MAARSLVVLVVLVALAGCERDPAKVAASGAAPPLLLDAAPSVPVAPPPPSSQPTATATADLGGHEAGAHMDHRARHGGLLLMNGDLHFEIVFDAAGRHRVHFSDAVRKALPASVASDVTLTITRKGDAPEQLALVRSDDDASWVSSGRPLVFGADDVARVAYTRANAKPYWIDVPITAPEAPSARGAAPHKHRHKHGAHE